MDYIRWYSDGKFGDPEKFDSDSNIDNNIFKIGDTVMIVGKVYLVDKYNCLRETPLKEGTLITITDTKSNYLVKLEGFDSWFYIGGAYANSFYKIS